jgi:hypothetical protein
VDLCRRSFLTALLALFKKGFCKVASQKFINSAAKSYIRPTSLRFFYMFFKKASQIKKKKAPQIFLRLMPKPY